MQYTWCLFYSFIIVYFIAQSGIVLSFSPMLPTLLRSAFCHTEWLFEPKLDGQRCLALCTPHGVYLLSRNQLLLNSIYPEIVQALQNQINVPCILDGEIVACKGQTISFSLLQQRLHLSIPDCSIIYYIFDLLVLDTLSLLDWPLEKRKILLTTQLKVHNPLRHVPCIYYDGHSYYTKACNQGLEGIVAKKITSSYTQGRSKNWFKIKCTRRQEFIVGGYTYAQSSAKQDLGALLLGYYTSRNKLIYAGKVGTGYSRALRRHLITKLEQLKVATTPFYTFSSPPKNIQWVHPKLVVEVEFNDWTAHDKVRHARFLGLRTDKSPDTIHKEKEEEYADMRTVKVGNHAIELTHEDKILFPHDHDTPAITKGDLIAYYHAIAPFMLYHIRNRPIVMHRFPEGIYGESFYHKNTPDYFPSWIDRITVPKKEGGTVAYSIINTSAALIYIANQGCITPHVWLSTVTAINQPVRMIFDLDPAPGNFKSAKKAALVLKDILSTIGLTPFVMTTGSQGLHVVVPLKALHNFDTVRTFAREIAEYMVSQYPQEFTTEPRKEKRANRLFIDVLRNAFGQTAVAPYAVRALPGAPIATPLTWDELNNPELTSQRYTMFTILQKIQVQGDPWKGINRYHSSLAQARKLFNSQHLLSSLKKYDTR